jgi:hypothetical protein
LFFWPIRAVAGKTDHWTVFWPGSLLEPNFHAFAAGLLPADLRHEGEEAFLKGSKA